MNALFRPTLLLAVSILALAQGLNTVHTQPDITGTGATVPLAASHTYAAWVQVTAATTNASTVRLGDSATSSTRGQPIAPGGSQFLPVSPTNYQYDLSVIYAYIATGDKVTVTWRN